MSFQVNDIELIYVNDFKVRCIFYRKMLGYFHYYTVVGVPSGIGAFFASFLVADRANYHYAHGLSTIVSNNIDNTVFFP